MKIIILFYFFYYQNVDKDLTSQTTEVEIEKTDNLDDNASFFENVEYKGIDANGNRYLLQSNTATFNKENPELVNMMGMRATFYFKDGTILYVKADNGIYNNKTLDMKFEQNVKANYMNSELFAEKAEYSNSESFLSIYENVRINDIQGNLIADKLLFDITSQKLDITSFSNGKINANVNLK